MIHVVARFLLLLLLVSSVASARYRVSTLAGAGPGSRDGTAQEARFSGPNAVAIDRAGNVWVADTHNHTIRVIEPTGRVRTAVGQAGASGHVDGVGPEARMIFPNALVFAPNGDLLMVDGSDRVRKLSPAGQLTSVVQVPMRAGHRLPPAIAVDPAGNAFVFNSDKRALVRIGLDGRMEVFAGAGEGHLDGPAAEARFDQVNGLAADAAGNLYVAEETTIRKVSPDGTVSSFVGQAGAAGLADGVGAEARFSRLGGLAWDPVSGDLFASQIGVGVIRRISAAGEVTTVTGALAEPDGSGGGAVVPVQFWFPVGLAVAADGSVVVADRDGHTIYRVQPGGAVTALGGANNLRPRDGLGELARFNHPSGIAVDRNGHFIVTDRLNNLIRRVTPDGQVSTIAGGAGDGLLVDGPAADARFWWPSGVAVATDGTIFVSDKMNNVIRRISVSGEVSTFAGVAVPFDGGSVGAQIPGGSEDGPRHQARFYGPDGLALDAAGNLFVADSENHTIRRISPSGDVTTVAGLAGQSGHVTGHGQAARFNLPSGLAVDRAGWLYVADAGNHAIRRISPTGDVTTYAGTNAADNEEGSVDGPARQARFRHPTGVAVDASGYVFVADSRNALVRRISPDGRVDTLAGFAGYNGYGAIEYGTRGPDDGPGTLARFQRPSSVAIGTGGRIYVTDSDNHAIRVLDPRRSARLANLSMRRRAGSGESTMIAGFVLDGSKATSVLVRGVGPGIGSFDVLDPLRDPRLRLFNGRGVLIDQNDDWNPELADAFGAMGAFPLDVASRDAALVRQLSPGSYSAHLYAAEGEEGTALLELYTGGEIHEGGFVNLSVRSEAGSGEETLIVGFAVMGEEPLTVLVRGVGPTLAGFKIANPVRDPLLRVFRDRELVAENDTCGEEIKLRRIFERIGAFPFAGWDSPEPAVLLTLEPGVYSAHLGSADGTAGVGMIEVYDVP